MGGRALRRLPGGGGWGGLRARSPGLLSASRPQLSIREPVTWQVPKQVFELRDAGLARARSGPALRGTHGPWMPGGLWCPRWETRGSAPEPLGSWSPGPGSLPAGREGQLPTVGAAPEGAGSTAGGGGASVSSWLLSSALSPSPRAPGMGGLPSQGLWAFSFHREEAPPAQHWVDGPGSLAASWCQAPTSTLPPASAQSTGLGPRLLRAL